MQKLILFPALALFFSCSSGDGKQTNSDSAKQQAVAAPPLKKGDFNDLSCVADGSNSYTAYLPSKYDSTKKWAVIIFFDAHGNGHLPLEKYKSLAEKWNFIFIGSNVSKNGMAMDQTMRIGDELIDEVKTRFSVDPNEIVLCGFSGGSRVAAAVAMNHSDVKGVICNSAAPDGPLTGKFFVGLAGLGDMNYLELKKYNDGLGNDHQSPHELLVFDGKHEWAPVNVFEDGMLIIGSYNLKKGRSAQNEMMVNALQQNILSQSDSVKKVSCGLAAHLLASGVRGCDSANEGDKFDKRRYLPIETAFYKFLNDPCVKSDSIAWKKAEDQESSLQNEISEAIISNDTTWWKANADKYFVTKSVGAEKFMRDRLRGYASLMCYSSANQALRVKNFHAAEKLISIYGIVDPTNSEWAYMKASLYMQIGMNDLVMPNLEKAIELGFSDHARLQNDPVFASLQNDAQFQALFSKMK